MKKDEKENSMIKIENNFANYYYLTEQGNIYNQKTDQIIEADDRHLFTLRTIDNKRKRIALKTLYKIVFNQNYCIDQIDNLEGEKWKQIDDTNGYYLISNKGRIKSLYGYNAIILKSVKNKKGYDRVDIRYIDKRRTKLVSRLVAAAFLPVPKSIEMQLHHKDFNKNNNSADNLEWLTPAAHNKIHAERRENVSTKSEENSNLENK